MPAVTIPIDELDGGIGQQPPSQRPANQVATCQNFLPSVAEGLVKRYGSEFVATVAVADPAGYSPNLSGHAYRLHPIERDQDELYLAIYGDSTLRIFDEAGTEATLTITAEAEAYLDSGNATADQLRLRTFSDTTFLINRTVTLAAEAAADFETRRFFPHPSAVFSFTGAANVYVRAESDDDVDQAGYFKYTLSGQTTITYPYIAFATITDGWSQPFGGQWDNGANQPAGFTISYSRRRLSGAEFATASWTFASRTLTVTGDVFSDYEFKNGDMIYVDTWSGTGTDGAWFEIESKTDDNNIVLKSGQSYSNADDATVDLLDSDSRCRIGNEIEIGFDLSQETISTMYDIAAVIERELNAAGAENMLCAWVPSSGGGGLFQITGPYRSSHGKVYSPTAPAVTGVYDLTQAGAPFNSTGATNQVGTGTLGTNAETRPPESRWTKVSAPNQPEAAPSETTMPMLLVRTASATFSMDVGTWDSRLDGDEFSNPIPEPFTSGSHKLADMALHRGRLVFLTGEYMMFTRSGDMYDFFVEDISAIADDDPIIVPLEGDSAVQGEALANFRKSLKVFAQGNQQFDVGTPEALTPTTISVTQSGKIRVLDVAPAVTGNLLYFMATLDNATALLESRYDDLSISLQPQNVSAHVPKLLPSAAKTIVSHEASGLTFILPEVGDTLYVYRTHFVETSKRQSAWTTWDFDNTINIIDIAVLGDFLYLFTTAAGYEYAIEKISLGREDAGAAAYTVHMDRRVVLTGTYDAGNDRTEFVLPILAAGSTINAYVEEDGAYDVNPGDGTWKYGTADGLSTDYKIAIPGDLSGQDITLGRYFRAETQLSRPYRRDQGGKAQIGDRLDIIQVFASFLEAGTFSIITTETNFAARTQTFTATGVVDEEGEFPAFLNTDMSKSTVVIRDDSPKPLKLCALQFEADASPASVR